MTGEKSKGRIMIIQLPQDFNALKGLASEVRLKILEILRKGERNVNEIKDEMGLPQSTIATNIMVLEEARLIETRNLKAAKGTQKICSALYDEFIIQFSEPNEAHGRHRGGDAHRALHRVQGLPPVRHVLDGKDHRVPGHPGLVPRARAREGGAPLVREGIRGLPVPQQCPVPGEAGAEAGGHRGAVLRDPRDQSPRGAPTSRCG